MPMLLLPSFRRFHKNSPPYKFFDFSLPREYFFKGPLNPGHDSKKARGGEEWAMYLKHTNIKGVFIKPVKGIIWDEDGTLINSAEHQYHWLAHAAKTFKGHFPFTQFDRQFLDIYNSTLAQKNMQGLYDLIEVKFSAQEKEIWAEYIRYNQDNTPELIKGIKEAITCIRNETSPREWCATGLRHAISTTKDYASAIRPLHSGGIVDFFDTISTKTQAYQIAFNGMSKKKNIAYDDFDELRKYVPEEMVRHLEKPNGFINQIALAGLGLPASNVIAIEDDARGVRSFKGLWTAQGQTNLYVVGVTWGFEPDAQKLLDAGADAIANKPSDLIHIVRRLSTFPWRAKKNT